VRLKQALMSVEEASMLLLEFPQILLPLPQLVLEAPAVQHRREPARQEEDERDERAEDRRARQQPCQVDGVVQAKEGDLYRAPVLRHDER
jgi:hypothetical protein